MPDRVTRATLNRTLLTRQGLDRRADRAVEDWVRHLVAVQAQEPDSPYLGLWARRSGFRREELADLLLEGTLVRAASLRRTQHIVAREDFGPLRTLLAEDFEKAPRQGFRSQLDGLDLSEVASVGREVLAGRTLTRPELGRQVAERFPGRDANALAWAVHFCVPLVHPPPSGIWRSRPAVQCALAEDRIAAEVLRFRPDAAALVRRYLRAFGPATVLDVQAWSGVRRLGPVVEAMADELRWFRGEDDEELVDLADAELVTATDAPVRFLPAFDNVVLGHADRRRIIADEHRPVVAPGQARVLPTVLIDGVVAATWSLRRGALVVRPFDPLGPRARRAVLEEAEALLWFAEDGSGSTAIEEV